MVTRIPQLVLKQMEFMKSIKEREFVEVKGLKINIQPFLFPPKSPYSYSTRVLLDQMEASKMRILEVGVGCGILSVAAAKQGAYVDGIDILPECIQISLDNAIENGVFQRTRFYYSNMFSNIDSNSRYDRIMCNLPILDGDLPDGDARWYSLFDPDFSFHKELFSKAGRFAPQITMAHADIAGPDDFQKLELLAKSYGWNPTVDYQKEYAGQKWRRYLFNLRRGI